VAIHRRVRDPDAVGGIGYSGRLRILITGAAGFIGSHLCESLVARGDDLDNFDGFYPRAIKQRNLDGLRAGGAAAPTEPGRAGSFSFVEGDIRRPAELDVALALAKPAVVVHLAALAGVRPSIADPGRYAEVNLLGTQNLLAACAAHGVSRLAFASSSSVYGLDSQVPFRESDPCVRPLSPYAATKRSGELLAFTAHHLNGLGVTNLRFFTVYGPRQRPDLAIHKFTRLLSSAKPIELYGDGGTSRDYTWIDDIVDGCVAAVDQLSADGVGGYRTYNLGGSQATTLLTLVELIARELGRAPEIVWLPEQPGDMKRTLADVTLAGHELGYRPRVAIEDGIKRFVDWYRHANL
jgi:UDP-glucuronate 4-epimerase